MRSPKLALGLCLIITLLGAGDSLAQPKISKENIKADIPEAVKKEIEKLYSTDPVHRGNACLKLSEQGTKAAPAVPFLVSMLGDRASVRRTQIMMPGNMLISAEFELSVSLGAIAGETLAKIGGPGFTALIEALKDKNPGVRASAASGLGEGKDRRAVGPLVLALADRVELVRARAATALGKIGDKQAIAPLLTALTDKSPYVRGAITSSLGEFKEGNTVKPLLERLNDPDSGVRTAAVASLGKLKSKEAVKPLIAALNEKHPRVRAAAASTLGKLKDNQALEPLIAAMKDNTATVRRAAASSLGDFMDAKAIPPLIEALNDLKDNELVNNAVTALQKITGADFGNDISKWQKWWEENQGKNTEN